ncbi:WGR domain-containing protein [Acuticoccus sp. MNP-M23]|uniref:WGR domain-containing protein n=1 Tax=Acuticoccus sp. MNP-M23 TaxID=3072793 RepID=UPI00281583D1|nr:WGR domain-containing protein [Acuticoccus sp. MNP-M23]WMS44897.1 WGR domain-containing protein [Acuticoccus sp. MNP-M23]
MQLDMFPTDLHLRCVDHTRNKHRFYALTVERTLFGEWVLVRQWGRIGVGGRTRRDFYPSIGPALDALRDLAQVKRRRGYTPH